MTNDESANETGAFLAVFAALLLDNVVRLEDTVGRVTDLVIGSGHPNREMIVTLQSFDRLKQEFEALGDALTRYAEVTNKSELNDDELAQLERRVISGITVADLEGSTPEPSSGRHAGCYHAANSRSGTGTRRS